MPQPLVLAIEPDFRQAAIVKRIVKEKALADITVVDSRDAAIEAMRTAMPDVLLLSALLSPRDEDELMAHLRTLDNAGHLQTHTIPQLASALGPGEGRGSKGLLSAFRRKKEAERPAPGCEPDLFAEEIRVYLQRAADKKRMAPESVVSAKDIRPAAGAARKAAAQTEEETEDVASSWESPFEWKPSRSAAGSAGTSPKKQKRAAAPEVPPAPPPIADEPLPKTVADPFYMEPPAAPEPVLAAPVVVEPPAPSESVLFAPPVEAPIAEPVITEAAAGQPLIVEPAIVEPLIADPAIVEPAAEDAVEAAPVRHSHSLVAEVVSKLEPEPEVVRATAEPLIPVAERTVSLDDATELVQPPHEIAAAASTEVVARDEAPSTEIVRTVDPTAAAAFHEPVGVRAERIAARLQDALAPVPDGASTFRSEWTREDKAVKAKIAESLGPLARWARSEPKKSKGAAAPPVTADDVRALMASLSVPPAVAWVSYPSGCRIRRVRVPRAPEPNASDSMGTVILSRRALAEQREKRTTA